ncbi:hypothetical protein [Streptomyces sp. NPDC059597]|uniref:hypothetical protein n=1 Tax=Streptomyces sp. NPDC059597 TaxID=3346879 RepID=UPI0036CC44F3
MSYYPAILAGQRITSALLTSLLPQTVNKAAGEDRFATTTLTMDADLQAPLEANAVYHVTMHIHYATTTAAGFQTNWAVPAGATGLRSSVSAGAASNTYSDTPGNWGVHNFGTAVNHGNRNSSTNQLWLLEEGVINTISAGTVALQWAQVTSNAAATRVGGGSFMLIRRIA